MICLHCGYCCIECAVIIIKPESVKENLRINKLTENDAQLKDSKVECPHLEWIRGKAKCKIHHYKWYKQTPCFKHGQIEHKNTNCRMGEYILKQGKNYNEVRNASEKKG